MQKLFRIFRKDERGNIAYLVAFAALPLLILSFGAVDFADGVAMRKNLQHSTDQAVLAALAKYRSRSREQTRAARNLFLGNLRERKRYGSIKASLRRKIDRGKIVMEFKVQAEAKALVGGFTPDKPRVINVVSHGELNFRTDKLPRLISSEKKNVFVRQE